MAGRQTLATPRRRRVATGLYAGWLFAVLGLVALVEAHTVGRALARNVLDEVHSVQRES